MLTLQEIKTKLCYLKIAVKAASYLSNNNAICLGLHSEHGVRGYVAILGVVKNQDTFCLF